MTGCPVCRGETGEVKQMNRILSRCVPPVLMALLCFSFFVWDVLVAVAIIDPPIITSEKLLPVDMNTQFGISLRSFPGL